MGAEMNRRVAFAVAFLLASGAAIAGWSGPWESSGPSFTTLTALYCRLTGCTMTGTIVTATSTDIRSDDNTSMTQRAVAGDFTLDAPDGGVVIGPNKARFTGAIQDETERVLFGGAAGAWGTGTVMVSNTNYLNTQFAGPVTVTAISGRFSSSSGGNATLQIWSGSNYCECTLPCAGGVALRAACTGNGGTGCAFAAGSMLYFAYGRTGASTSSGCSTTQHTLFNLSVMGKFQ